ncbi:hypothetical protein CLOM_g21770 [Closterium sp. NIES-68]|nr:hypothetical protein CLOM_g21770 [Closterium sp. NIES-68]GJP79860.1 hypothetical protein CLOP_g10061 [Closterium sp. NIES-67]
MASASPQGEASSETVRLFSAWFCPFAQRAWIALEAKGVKYEYIEVDPYAKPAELMAVNPRGLVPALLHVPQQATSRSRTRRSRRQSGRRWSAAMSSWGRPWQRSVRRGPSSLGNASPSWTSPLHPGCCATTSYTSTATSPSPRPTTLLLPSAVSTNGRLLWLLTQACAPPWRTVIGYGRFTSGMRITRRPQR